MSQRPCLQGGEKEANRHLAKYEECGTQCFDLVRNYFKTDFKLLGYATTARYCVVFAMWGEPLAAVRAKIDEVHATTEPHDEANITGMPEQVADDAEFEA